VVETLQVPDKYETGSLELGDGMGPSRVKSTVVGFCLGCRRTADPSTAGRDRSATPDLLSSFMALANFMRLSSKKAAHVRSVGAAQ
jgi:hypothetical protein